VDWLNELLYLSRFRELYNSFEIALASDTEMFAVRLVCVAAAQAADPAATFTTFGS
jgi:hypothetical protein